MTAIRMFLAGLLLLAGALVSPALADGPKVVSITPSDGEINVSTGLGQIVVEFDRPMDTSSYSVMIVDGAPFPPLVKDAKPWESATRFVLKLQPLDPNTQYSFQLNSPSKTGFQSADDKTALAPMRVTFTTGGKSGDAPR